MLLVTCKSKQHFNILASSLHDMYNNTLIAHSAEEIQMIVDAFAIASSKFALKINIKKTDVMFQTNSTMTMEEDINAFMMRHLRSIMKIKWQDKVTNIKVLKWAGLPSMEDLLIRKNLCWTGHLLRMATDRLPRQVLYSQLPDGQRPCDRQRLRYKDTIKRNLKKRDIYTNSWKYLALQRDVWRYTVK